MRFSEQKRIVMLRVVMLFVLTSSLALAALGSDPKPGEPAPAFSLPTSAGSTIALKDYKGQSKLVLVFYRGYW
jgi:hypothetical protein